MKKVFSGKDRVVWGNGEGSIFPAIPCEKAQELASRVESDNASLGDTVMLCFHLKDVDTTHAPACPVTDTSLREKLNIS